MYQNQSPKINILQYLGMGIFVVGVVWGILLSIDWLGNYLAPPVTVSEEVIPDFLQLKSRPQDVLYAEAYVNSRGEEELRYAYATGGVESVDGEAIDRRTPNSRTEVLSVEQKGNEKIETLSTSFYSAPQFYEDNGQWRQIEYATTTPEVFSASGAIQYVQRREWWERLLPGQPLFAQTSTFRPDPNTETSSVDGFVAMGDQSPDWSVYNKCSAVRDDISGNALGDSDVNFTVGVTQTAFDFPPLLDNQGEDEFGCEISRGFFLFDTSSLPNDAVVSAATLQVYVNSRSGSEEAVVTSSNPASNTGLVLDDYPDVGTTLLSNTISVASMTTGAYNTFTLNATGMTNISTTGVTKKAIRMKNEIDATFSSIISGGVVDNFSLRAAETTGTSQDPRLDVTYTASSFSIGQWFPF